MKIQGKKVEGVNVITMVFPRQDGLVVVLKAAGIQSYEEFDKMCPTPEPTEKIFPNGSRVKNTKDPKFQEAVDIWAKRKVAWMIIKSLEVTEGLEWETVDMLDPETWENYLSELTSCGFTEAEMARIVGGVTSANGINQQAIDEAEKHFLADQGQVQ